MKIQKYSVFLDGEPFRLLQTKVLLVLIIEFIVLRQVGYTKDFQKMIIAI